MRASAAALAALLLASCGGQERSGNGAAGGKAGDPAAANSAGAAAAQQQGGPLAAGLGARSIQPGLWEMTASVTQMEMPGAPPEVQARIAAQRNRQQTSRTCITPERAANPLREFREAMARGQQGANCQAVEDVFAGGVIRIRAVCRPAGGGPGVGQMAMAGSFTATTLQATLSVNTEAAGPPGRAGPRSVRMSSTVSGRRVGDCPRGSEGRTAR